MKLYMTLYHDTVYVIASNHCVTILLLNLTLDSDTLHSSYIVKIFNKYNLNYLAIVSQICGETLNF